MTEIERLENRKGLGLLQDEVAELCFAVIMNCTDVVEQSRAAIILSGIIKRGLGERTRQFLKKNPNVPRRVRDILSANFLRMEGF